MRVLVIAAFLVAMAMPVVLAGPAHAHATLVSSEPAEGAVIPAPPPRLILTFNEPVSPLALRLVAPDSSSTVVQATVKRETSLAIALPSELHNGTHVLSWRVVSLDGHPIGGTVVFSIGAPSVGPRPAAQSSAQPAVSAALWTLKVVFYVGLFAGTGGSFFLPGLPGMFEAAGERRSRSSCWRVLPQRRCWSVYRVRMRWSCRYRDWQTGRHGRRDLQLHSEQRRSPLLVHSSQVLLHFKREAPARFRCSVSQQPVSRWR